MKKYVVRVEVLKTALHYVDIDVEADGKYEAKLKACTVFNENGVLDSALIEGGRVDYELDLGDMDAWNVEEEWAPKVGDLIEVSNDDNSWCLRTLIAMTQAGRFVCWVADAQKDVFIWEFGRSAKCR